jgi:hypothetical protein
MKKMTKFLYKISKNCKIKEFDYKFLFLLFKTIII